VANRQREIVDTAWAVLQVYDIPEVMLHDLVTRLRPLIQQEHTSNMLDNAVQLSRAKYLLSLSVEHVPLSTRRSIEVFLT
jgi:hypothetical protein